MSNSGTKWTKEEEDNLLEQIKLGRTFSIIAKKHNRSEIAIHLRFASIINDKLTNKKNTIESIAHELNMKPNSIKNIMENATKFTNNNNTSFTNDSDKHLYKKLEILEQKIDNIEKYCKLIYKKLTK